MAGYTARAARHGGRSGTVRNGGTTVDHGGRRQMDGRRDGGLNGRGGTAQKERHGKEWRHDGRLRQRTAGHWAAGQKRLSGGRQQEGARAGGESDG